jgi:RNA ligase
MKLLDYLGITNEELQEYIDSGMIDSQHHETFPLVILTYGRKAVADNTWPAPVRKCRGLIVREDTEEIIARPYEKFFNLGTAGMPETEMAAATREPDALYEKMDGFLCILYEWEGQKYLASKGSFHSTHAKWATATYRKLEEKRGWPIYWPTGCTPVFEGITKNLRIVVDYGDREELVLTGIVDIESGEETTPSKLWRFGQINRFKTPTIYPFTLAWANKDSLTSGQKNFEGYVAYWQRPGQTPLRLKIKYTEYLRIHRMVSGVSPKRIFEALQNGWPAEMNEWLDDSTPWFNKFVATWKSVLETKYKSLVIGATNAYVETKAKAYNSVATLGSIGLWTRKQWAEEFKKYPEDLQPILFAMFDGKNIEPFIWKRVKPIISGSRPMVDAHKT